MDFSSFETHQRPFRLLKLISAILVFATILDVMPSMTASLERDLPLSNLKAQKPVIEIVITHLKRDVSSVMSVVEPILSIVNLTVWTLRMTVYTKGNDTQIEQTKIKSLKNLVNFSVSVEKIANVGTDSHTVVYHAIKRYDTLSDMT